MKKMLVIFVLLFITSSCNNQIDKKTIVFQDSKSPKNNKGNILISEQQDKDSLNFYLQKSERLKKEHKPDLALEELNFALYYASTPQDIEIVKKEIMEVDY